MRTLHVVVHPEATHHVERLVGGWFDSELTPKGLQTAQLIARSLRAKVPSGELITSDLRRTVQTAEVIGKALNLQPQPDARFREKSYGVAGGQPQRWLDARFVPPPEHG